MTEQEFIPQALKTESRKESDQAIGKNLLEMIRQNIGECRISADYLDDLKKHLFYGRALQKPHGFNPDSDTGSTPISARKMRLLHGAMGMITEVAELMDSVASHVLNGVPIDQINIAEELGDVEWYRAILLDELDLHPDMIRAACIAKLRKRYGDKFDSLKAVTRDLGTERKTLEANL